MAETHWDEDEVAEVKLWAPKEFREGDTLFLLNATHRGDMYHFRAAMELGVKYSAVYLYNCCKDDKYAQQVKEYLKRSARKAGKHIFVSSVEDIKAKPNITDCYLDDENNPVDPPERRTFTSISERKATTEINSIGEQCTSPEDPQLANLKDGMCILEPNSKSILDARFQNKFTILDPNQPTILVMCRDTGTGTGTSTGDKKGVHPELDSGIKSIEHIVDIIHSLTAANGQKMRAVLCGNRVDIVLPNRSNGGGEPSETPVPSIKEYWTELGPPPSVKDTARDVEAYFLKWAYEQKYYSMVVGFRSGALDLFTFMGIPTVSLGLQDYAGEQRHGLLALDVFQRVNIQYNQPRQRSTRFTSPPSSSTPVPTGFTGKPRFSTAPPRAKRLFSPYWGNGERPGNYEELLLPPRAFSPFDKVTVEVGLHIACQKHEIVSPTKYYESVPASDSLPNVVTTSVARFFYPSNLDLVAWKEEVKRRRGLDEADLKYRNRQGGWLLEDKKEFNKIQGKSESDWGTVKKETKRLETGSERSMGGGGGGLSRMMLCMQRP